MADSKGGEKTEKATSKKRKDTKEKGNILKSSDLGNAVVLVVMFGALKVFGPKIALSLNNTLITFLDGSRMPATYTNREVMKIMIDGIYLLIITLAPLLITVLIAGITINIVQTGFYFSTKSLSVKMERINPLEGFKRIFSVNSVVEMLKSIGKILIIGVVLYQEITQAFSSIPNMMIYDLRQTFSKLCEWSLNIAFKACVALIVLAVLDYLFQWWKYEKDMMMTKQEVKDEFKLLEGNPEIKGRIRQIQREIAMKRMMQAVPNADVVITNPTHYAIALRYDEKTSASPVVIAKGKNMIALKIKEIAKENKVEIVENKVLAQTLYASCDIGSQIPEELFKAVAEILAYVYKLKRKR